MTLSVARLRKLLIYDPETGIFRGRVARSNVPAGLVTGSVSKSHGYVEIRIDGTVYLAHRLAWLYMTGSWPIETIDHRDTLRANNAFVNLRQATKGQNNCNRGPRADNKSGLKGVYLSARGKWIATYKPLGGKSTYLGSFNDSAAAKAAYDAAATAAFGEFARAL